MTAAAILLGAKLEEHRQPTVKTMIRIFKEKMELSFEKDKILKIERDILKGLEFESFDVYPMLFVERYFRIFGFDKNSKTFGQIFLAAKIYCKVFQREAESLEFCPSRLAAACVLLAMNVCTSRVAKSVGIR